MRKGLLIAIPVVVLFCLIHISHITKKEADEAEITQQTLVSTHETETESVQFEPEWAIIENTQASDIKIEETEPIAVNPLEMETEPTNPPVTKPVSVGDDITGGGDVGAGGEIDWD